jgi:hypothetical protein
MAGLRGFGCRSLKSIPPDSMSFGFVETVRGMVRAGGVISGGAICETASSADLFVAAEVGRAIHPAAAAGTDCVG